MRWTNSKYADLIPVLAFAMVMGGVIVIDKGLRDQESGEATRQQQTQERRAGMIQNGLSQEVSLRLGTMMAKALQFTNLEDSLSQRSFSAAADSVVNGQPGLTGVSVIYKSGHILAPRRSLMSGITIENADTAIRRAYVRALATHEPAATGVLPGTYGRRVIVFRPIVPTGADSIIGILAAEIDPATIYSVVSSEVLDSINGANFTVALWGPRGERITAPSSTPKSWLSVRKPVKVADTEWQVEVRYQPTLNDVYAAQRTLVWAGGLVVALAISLFLLLIRRTITTQREEIMRRQAAEEAARQSAEEARARAQEARELAGQLEAAQRASQRLSTSLDPDDVVELFLGGVAEILEADVASLYTFEEVGELVVGRKRMVFREIEGVTDRFAREDIRQIRAPIALLPQLAEPVSSGEAYITDERGEGALATATVGGEAPASLAVPLMIAGHTVGVATWEVYGGTRKFPPALVAFAQALAAPAAAALRTAELFSSLEEERMRASWEAVRFAAVLDQMADGVVVVDRNGRIERTNNSAEELIGEDLAGAPVDAWVERYELAGIDGRPMPPAEFPMTRALRGERVRRANFIVRSPWGGERHLSSSAGPIMGPSGELTGAAMVLRDVTDEHQYAEMLRHTNRELRRQAEVLEEVNQQLRDATKAKDQFLAVMSHELRTPINAIMGYSDLLDLGVKGPLNDDQRGMLARVRDTSRHLLGLINEVLDLAKIGAGRMDLVMVEVNVSTVVDRAVQQIMPIADGKSLKLELRHDTSSKQPIVLADETRLTQIVINLLSNAVKFTNTGTVTASYVRNGDRIEVHVVDTGPGISEEQQERIFEEFYQVEGGLARSSGGTGLGLAIARRFARLMGGDIRVTSELGNGAEFVLELPSVEARIATEEQGGEGTVVLLRQNDAYSEQLDADLEGAVRLISVDEPAQLAALARQESADLVAIDARSASSGAWRSLAALQADRETSALPVQLFASEDEGGEMVLDLGAFLLLGKPLSVESAVALVERAGGGPHRRVLIADEDVDVRRILGEALIAAGHRVRTAADGADMLQLARTDPPHVAIVHLLLPGINGIEVMAQLRTNPNLRDVPLVALLSREPSPGEMERLSRSIDALSRGRRARAVALGDLIRNALLRLRRIRATEESGLSAAS
jgi:PAS domain S-box-containing protein